MNQYTITNLRRYFTNDFMLLRISEFTNFLRVPKAPEAHRKMNMRIQMMNRHLQIMGRYDSPYLMRKDLIMLKGLRENSGPQMHLERLNHGLQVVCKMGDPDMITLMIKLGATDLNRGLHGACQAGSLSLVNMLIAKGAKDWNGGLIGVCLSKYKESRLADLMEIMKLLVRRGANNWNDCIEALLLAKDTTQVSLGAGAFSILMLIKHYQDKSP